MNDWMSLKDKLVCRVVQWNDMENIILNFSFPIYSMYPNEGDHKINHLPKLNSAYYPVTY